MREETGDIWEAYNAGCWIVIPTNGFVRNDGTAVMGRGLAWQAKERFPILQLDLGERLKEYGNHVFVFSRYRIITFPVKHKWMEDANVNLIQRSCMELMKVVEDAHGVFSLPIYIPRVGCGNGKLDWNNVKPILASSLDDRFIVISLENQA